MSHIEVGPCAEIAVPNLVEAQGKLPAVTVNTSEVGCGRCGTKVSWYSTRAATDQNILTAVSKDIEATGYKAMKKCKVETKVALFHRLPTHIGIAELTLTVDSIRRVAQWRADLGGSSIRIGILIEPSATDIVVTDNTP